ncbi:MAG TPA: hypothetical protein VIM61_09755 [Chthoniobacterales bacterium]|jgi:hypothetical protein
MRDLKIKEAARIEVIDFDALNLQWPATRGARDIFRENVIRTARMVEVPAYAALTADFHRLAIHRVCGGEPTQETIPLIHSRGDEITEILGSLINQDTETIRMFMTGLIANLDQFIKRTTNINEVFEAFLNGVLIQAWTSFEVVMRQLLRDSTKLHPECFSALSLEDLTNLQTKSYQKLESIRRAYIIGFSNYHKVTNPINEQCVDALGASPKYLGSQCRSR